MDTITTMAMSIQNPLLTNIGMLLNDYVIYVAVLLVLVFVGEKRNKKREKIFLAIIIAAIAALSLKELLVHDRPCVETGWCPYGYSFPSAHAATVFALMLPFLNKKNYVGYLAFALFVSFTRLNLGVHIFQDIAGGLIVAILSYYIVDIIYRGKKNG
ncbi:phosphatase PAP2 family protein [Candidatus Micrarchaeota archaeon]|nr:phosphatase PAP2 family protein [Candidatus Micrarchaeota archaeon]MBU1165441.1 phosphatase PAP2 family protein [Candidatus Micrarchaeota archaeon]MBU1887422.1 phosphatase PAP2 family protein [Candidatus Micrarchaeota archaeon]